MQMQIVEPAIAGTNSLDDSRLAQFTRDRSFKTVPGNVKFGSGDGWSEARVLQVQDQNIRTTDLAEFKDVCTQVVVSPGSLASDTLIYPQRRNGTCDAQRLALSAGSKASGIFACRHAWEMMSIARAVKTIASASKTRSSENDQSLSSDF
jgi:hypothetical protein